MGRRGHSFIAAKLSNASLAKLTRRLAQRRRRNSVRADFASTATPEAVLPKPSSAQSMPGLAVSLNSRTASELGVWSVDNARSEWTKIPVEFEPGVSDISILDLNGARSIRSERVWQETGKMVPNREVSTVVAIRGPNRSIPFRGAELAVTAFPGTSCVVIGGATPGRLSMTASLIQEPAMLVDWASGETVNLGEAQLVAVLSAETY